MLRSAVQAVNAETRVRSVGSAGVREWRQSGKAQVTMTNLLTSRRGFWTFAVLTWEFAMVVGVVGVGLFLHASLGAFVFVAC
jgi:hypothetical protein